MIVMFVGGPAAGLYRSLPTDLAEIRVGTPELLAEGKAAVYTVGLKEREPRLRIVQAVAHYSGDRDTAAALVRFSV